MAMAAIFEAVFWACKCVAKAFTTAFLIFLLYEFIMLLEAMWRVMVKDRAQYLLDEDSRRQSNEIARREKLTQFSAMLTMGMWARERNMCKRGTPASLAALVETVYFPARNYEPHFIVSCIAHRVKYLRWRYLNGPAFVVHRQDWELAHARAKGLHQMDLRMDVFEEAFGSVDPPSYGGDAGQSRNAQKPAQNDTEV